MSANDVLDVLNIQRPDSPPKKKAKKEDHAAAAARGGMSRELYQLLGPNTPSVNLQQTSNWKAKATPWTRKQFKPHGTDVALYHWVRGSGQVLANEDTYLFGKYNTAPDIPEINEAAFDRYMAEISKEQEEKEEQSWTYEETVHLFDLCRAFELKWQVITDRFKYNRPQEDLKLHFYTISLKIYQEDENANPALIEALQNYSKAKEIERKTYLEKLLKRTPAEIAEEESLVIESRRFELAAKKMLLERSNLLALLDSPQTSQLISQYQTSSGLLTLYNNLMIMDKSSSKKRSGTPIQVGNDPIPPPIPLAASLLVRKERSFQTHLQQYLAGVYKQQMQQGGDRREITPIQRLLMKRLTSKEEEYYGLHYHEHEKITPGVVLRSGQRLQGLQQRQSVLKNVTTVLNELDIPNGNGTAFKPVMPTRKTMQRYDELLKAVVALLDVKRGRDKLDAEIALIRSQRNLD